MKTEKKFKIDAKLENLNLVFEYLDELLQEKETLFKNINSIEVSFEEIFTNICNYAYGNSTGRMEIKIDTDEEKIIIQLKDEGTPFDPLKKEDPDTSAPIEERKIGGLGIFLVKKLMDNFEYRFEDGKNINILTKYLYK